MRCDDILNNLPDYLLGKVEPNLKRSIEVHLQTCDRCREEMQALRRPVSILGEIQNEEYPDEFWQELRLSIMERISRPVRAKWRVPVAAGAMTVILALVGIAVYQSFNTSSRNIESVSVLASSLPADQVVSLPSLNTNYVDVASAQTTGMDEMDAVDDSVREAVVRSLWASLADSSGTIEVLDYSGSGVLN